jgi:hypothetical protein
MHEEHTQRKEYLQRLNSGLNTSDPKQLGAIQQGLPAVLNASTPCFFVDDQPRDEGAQFLFENGKVFHCGRTFPPNCEQIESFFFWVKSAMSFDRVYKVCIQPVGCVKL